jgi:spore coat protein JB
MTGNGKPNKEQLLQLINEVSFAVNDIILYLDTHPCDEKALAFYREKVAIRNEALKEYAACFGPLTIDTADDTCSDSWEWVMQPWPWEVKGGCR